MSKSVKRWIRVGDAKPGDIVRRVEDGPLLTVDPERFTRTHVKLNGSSPGLLMLHQSTHVLLVHRPWPAGKTEQDMQEDIFQSLFSRNMSLIGEAIEAYELGKPLEETEE